MKIVITKDLIKYLARLSHLSLDDQQIAKLESDLSRIMNYMDEIKVLNLDDVPETAGVVKERNIWRQDNITPSLTQKEALKNAKSTYKNYFSVKNIFKNRVNNKTK
jgi:aspartyl-tRNA(Asn)/glutamyl-tRNA(Gln) amidotransferase subunit C